MSDNEPIKPYASRRETHAEVKARTRKRARIYLVFLGVLALAGVWSFFYRP